MYSWKALTALEKVILEGLSISEDELCMRANEGSPGWLHDVPKPQGTFNS